MMETIDNLDEVFNEVVYNNNAQEVFKRLKALDKQRDLARLEVDLGVDSECSRHRGFPSPVGNRSRP
jgi:hypothetical protein